MKEINGSGVLQSPARQTSRGSASAGDAAQRHALVLGHLVEHLGELLHHGAAELLGVDDGHGPAVIAGDVVSDAQSFEAHWNVTLDPVPGLRIPNMLDAACAGDFTRC